MQVSGLTGLVQPGAIAFHLLGITGRGGGEQRWRHIELLAAAGVLDVA
jgi:hypothetical protein